MARLLIGFDCKTPKNADKSWFSKKLKNPSKMKHLLKNPLVQKRWDISAKRWRWHPTRRAFFLRDKGLLGPLYPSVRSSVCSFWSREVSGHCPICLVSMSCWPVEVKCRSENSQLQVISTCSEFSHTYMDNPIIKMTWDAKTSPTW